MHKPEVPEGPCQPVYVHTYGLDRETWEKLFDRVADAAHALDESVSCSGGDTCALCAEPEPVHARLSQTRRNLEHEKSMRAQAEDRSREWEETARRAEERAEELRNDRDGWANFAHDLANEHLINQYAHDRLNNRRAITEHLYEIWSTGTPIDDLGVQSVVQDYNEAIR